MQVSGLRDGQLGERKAHGNVVTFFGLISNYNGDDDDDQELKHQSPPSEIRESLFHVTDYGADEGNEPSELAGSAGRAMGPRVGLLTMEMEMVARANGSPMMRAMSKRAESYRSMAG